MPETKSLIRPGLVGRQRAAELRQFILDNLERTEFTDIRSQIQQRFQDVPRHVVHKQLARLESRSLIEGRGKTKGRLYKLVTTISTHRRKVAGLQEYDLWKEVAEPSLRDLPKNVLDTCHYGFTEMVNNVIDHSESETIDVAIHRSVRHVQMQVLDEGVGIFRKIQQALELPSLQEALFELTKGKFTTDPSKHTGEGIFFTSRAFDNFRLFSTGLTLDHTRAGDDWLMGTDHSMRGTYVFMTIDATSTHTIGEVFDHYTAHRDDFAFNKTNVVLRLLDTGDESFVSRSQAKRVLNRLPRFREVTLDFEGVSSIGPAFADEIFRVFRNGHPDVNLTPIRANADVQRMITRALQYKPEP